MCRKRLRQHPVGLRPAAADHGGRRKRSRGNHLDLQCARSQYRYAQYRTIESMRRAGLRANALGHPVVFDPVGAGASALRTGTAQSLLRDVRFCVVRGNSSEIRAGARRRHDARCRRRRGRRRDRADALDDAVFVSKRFPGRPGRLSP